MSGLALITGAAGFIGSHVAEAMVRAGRTVVGIDNFDPFYDEALKRDNLREVERAAAASSAGGGGGGSFVFERADIREAGDLRRVFEKHRPETVVHLAAKAGVRPSIAEPALYAQVNVTGTVNVFEACRRAGCERVLMASSSSVYGNASRAPFREDDEALAPISPYAATKRACELLAHTYHHLYGLRVASLRFFTAYGPRQRPDLAIMSFLRRTLRGEALPVFGDGSMRRDFTFIDDIVQGVMASEGAIDRHGLRVWNLGGAHPVSVAELVGAIGRVTGIEPRIERRPEQPGDVARTFADLTRSRAELGFEPHTALEDGLHRQWAWLKARGG